MNQPPKELDFDFILFHGTTHGRAERMLKTGLRPPAPMEEVARVANQFDLDAGVVAADLDLMKRFSAWRHDDRALYTTTSFEKARSYASRAPEVEWEALWAVYRIAHPELGFAWNQSNEGHLWVLNQQSYDVPVVLELVVPGSTVRSFEEPEQIRLLSELQSAGKVYGREVKLPAGGEFSVKSLTVCDRWVDGSLLLFIHGGPVEQLVAEVDSGLWGSPDVYHHERMWRWADVRRGLSPERMEELEIR